MIHSFEPFLPDAVAFLARHTGIDFSRTNFANTNAWLCATARDDSGAVRGVCCFELTTDFEAHFTTAIEDPRCVTRRLLRAMFSAIFMRVVRVTAMCEPHNERAIRQALALGFQHEGFMRCVIEGTRDAIVMGMLCEDCRYLARPATKVIYEKPKAA